MAVRVQYRGAGGQNVVSPYDWVVSDAGGALYLPVVDGLGSPLPERELGPDQTAQGRVGFVVPRTARGLVLTFDSEVGDGSAQVPITSG